MWCLVTVNVLLILVSESAPDNLPADFPKCGLEDPELENCILNAAEQLRPQIRKGIEEVKIPRFEPLSVRQVGIVQEAQQINYTSMFSNCSITGLDNYKFKSFRYNPSTMTFNGSVEFKTVGSNCFYELSGKVLWFPMQGKGVMIGSFDDAKAEFELTGKMETKKGVAYYRPVAAKVRGIIADVHYDVGGLFDGNEQMARMTNYLLNQNSKQIVKEITPMFEKLSEEGVMRMMKLFMRSVPYNKLFSSKHQLQ